MKMSEGGWDPSAGIKRRLGVDPYFLRGVVHHPPLKVKRYQLVVKYGDETDTDVRPMQTEDPPRKTDPEGA